MKKLLLIAAMAALALGANADGYKFEKVWELNTSSVYSAAGVDISNVRQGFGMNGKFYFNDKNTADGAIPTIYEVDENGLTGVTFEGGRNCGITYDEAGNIIVSDATFPGGWVQATIKVINPTTGEVKVYEIPEECGMQGRCDFLGIPKGNMMETGVLYLTGKTNADVFTDGVAVFAVTDGEVDFDNCYLGICDVIQASHRDNMTVCNYYEDINGEPSVLFVYRSMGTTVRKLAFDGDNFVSTTITLPGKGACNGTFPFIWDGMELFVYPQAPNYFDGFAISEANAEEPMFVVEPTVSVNQNGYQSNWLNAEVDENGVTIYQYAPGAKFTVWRLTKDTPEPPKVYMLGGDDQAWDPTSGTEFDYDTENNVYTATINFPAEFNYFGFTTELAENNDDGGWGYIEPFRFGAIADEGTDFWYEGQDFISLTWDDYHAIRIAGGEYKLTINLEEMKLYVEALNNSLRGDVDMDGTVGIADVTALIDYILSGDETNKDLVAADADLDGVLGIADVTTIIDYILTHTW